MQAQPPSAAPRSRPKNPLILAPSGAGLPGAAELRLGPAYILAELEPPLPDVHRPRLGDCSVAAVAAAVAAATATAAAKGGVPVVIGGDHTVALGAILGVRDGLRRRHRSGRSGPTERHGSGSRQGAAPDAGPGDVPLFVLWLDAHPDLNTTATSPTGHLHGMVLAGLLGEGPLAAAEPLPASRVILAGVRAFDPGERRFLQARPELVLWDVELLRDDSWMAPADALLEQVACAGGRLYVSLDLDVLDPVYAPGVAVPERYGALPDPLLGLLRRVRASGLLAGADLVEFYPPADRERQTSRLAARALMALGAVTLPWEERLESGDLAPTLQRGRRSPTARQGLRAAFRLVESTADARRGNSSREPAASPLMAYASDGVR